MELILQTISLSDHLNQFSAQQIHIISTNEQFIEGGYFIKPMSYWQELFPNAILIEYETKKVFNSESLKIPLCWGMVSE